MDKRNVPLTPNTAYNVKTDYGTWYTIYSETVLNNAIARGDIGPNDKVFIRRIANV